MNIHVGWRVTSGCKSPEISNVRERELEGALLFLTRKSCVVEFWCFLQLWLDLKRSKLPRFIAVSRANLFLCSCDGLTRISWLSNLKRASLGASRIIKMSRIFSLRIHTSQLCRYERIWSKQSVFTSHVSVRFGASHRYAHPSHKQTQFCTSGILKKIHQS